jgi:hypothetical protein
MIAIRSPEQHGHDPDQNAIFFASETEARRADRAAAHSRPLPRRIKGIENPSRSRNARGITNQPAGRQGRGVPPAASVWRRRSDRRSLWWWWTRSRWSTTTCGRDRPGRIIGGRIFYSAPLLPVPYRTQPFPQTHASPAHGNGFCSGAVELEVLSSFRFGRAGRL